MDLYKNIGYPKYYIVPVLVISICIKFNQEFKHISRSQK